MVIEFWQKNDSSDIVIGYSKISLHQFYLGYRNPVILKYANKNKLPVIGTDWWVPIYTIDTDEILGQVQVLIALGTEEQINNLKAERGFTSHIVTAKFTYPKPTDHKGKEIKEFNATKKYNQSIDSTKSIHLEFSENNRYQSKATNTSISPKKNLPVKKINVGTQFEAEMDKKNENIDKNNPTQEMLGSFLNQLMSQRQRNIFVENGTNTEIVEPETAPLSQNLQQAQSNTNLELRKTTDLLESLQKALSIDSTKIVQNTIKKAGTFRANVAINSANHLPSRKKCKSKKSRNRSIKNEENVLPSCYVTFETLPGEDLKITTVAVKSIAPSWNFKCDVDLPVDLLTNGQRRLIFKVWRKSTNTVMVPNMETDIILGFAAVDLTVLLSGFPNVQGWFNIMDFSGKCNGQINIHVIPSENLSKYQLRREEYNCHTPTSKPSLDPPKPELEPEPSELLSRALKRKFTELDEITQRLRLRLSKVTNEDSDASSDGMTEEFEKDINSLCVEEDFDLINFEEEVKKLSARHSKEKVESRAASNVIVSTLLPTNDNVNNDCVNSNLFFTNDTLETKGDSRVGMSAPLMSKDTLPLGKDEQLMDGVVEEKMSNSSNANSGLVSEVSSNVLSIDTSSGTEKEATSLDRHLHEGKQRIDSLLEKLTLLSAEASMPFTSRYVSGCSITTENPTNIDTEAILKELDQTSRPNIQSSSGFDPIKFQQLYGGSIYSNSSKNSAQVSQTSNSDTSLITNFSDCRPAPDGQGNILEDAIKKD